MTKHKNHIEKTSTFSDFIAYLRNMLTSKEQHAFEKRTIEDDFEGEALEGFENFDIFDIEPDYKELRQRIKQRRRNQFPYWKVAAAVSLLLSATVVLFFLLKPLKTTELSEVQKDKKEESVSHLPEKELPEIITDSNVIDKQADISAKKTQYANKSASSNQNRDTSSESLAYVAPTEDIDVELDLDENVSEAKNIDNIALEGAHPMRENELEPLPETGTFNRIASAQVKTSDNTMLNQKQGEMPTRFKYHEGMNDNPKNLKKKNLAVTMAGKTYSKSAKSESAETASSAAKPAPSKMPESQKATPVNGYESYYNYLYDKIQQTNLSENELPVKVLLNLMITAQGDIMSISYVTDVGEELKTQLNEILKNGPRWVAPSVEGKSYATTVELELDFAK